MVSVDVKPNVSWVPCVLKRAYKTGIAALSVAIPCASQKLVMCMIWAVHETGSRQATNNIV